MCLEELESKQRRAPGLPLLHPMHSAPSPAPGPREPPPGLPPCPRALWPPVGSSHERPRASVRAQERARLGAPQWQQLGCPNTIPYTHTSHRNPPSPVLFLMFHRFPVGVWGKATDDAEGLKRRASPGRGEGVGEAGGRHREGLLS